MRASAGAGLRRPRPHPIPLPGGEGTLDGCRVLVTRSPGQAEELCALLHAAGAEVVELPTIAIELADLTHTLPDLTTYAWAVFTSPNGVRAVTVHRTRTWPRIAVVGASTAAAAEQAGLRVAFRPSEPRGAVLGEDLPIRPGDRVLLLRSDIARPDLPAALRRRGAIVDEVVAYRTTPRSEPAPEIAEGLATGRIDAIVLSSPSSARGLVAACGRDPSTYTTARIVAIGPTTAAAIAELGLPVAAQAAEPSDRGLFEALVTLRREE
jgi:uroporphyrinogen-III synthase